MTQQKLNFNIGAVFHSQQDEPGTLIWVDDPEKPGWAVVLKSALRGDDGVAIPVKLPQGYTIWVVGFRPEDERRLCDEFSRSVQAPGGYAEQCRVMYKDDVDNEGTLHFCVVGPDGVSSDLMRVEQAVAKGYQLWNEPPPRPGRMVG